jgi:hypothetical protein
MISGNAESINLVLTPRDLLLIYAVWSAGHYSAAQIASFFWPGEDESALRGAQRRLRQLVQADILRRVDPWVKQGHGRKSYLYAIGRAAQGVLCREFMLELAAIDWKPKTSLENNFLFMDHILATNDLHISVALSARKYGYALESWTDEKLLRKREMRDGVTIKDSEGNEKRVTVIPDAAFALQAGEKWGHFLVEIDRGTITISRGWTEKIKALLQYQQSGAYERRYHTGSFRVLTVTTGAERLAHLKQAAEAVGGTAQFWFTTFDRVVQVQKVAKKLSAAEPSRVKYMHLPVYNKDLLSGKIWYKAGSDNLPSLLE